MDSNAFRREEFDVNPEMIRYFEQHGRQQPESTLFFYSLAQKAGGYLRDARYPAAFIIRRIYRCAVYSRPHGRLVKCGPTRASEIAKVPADGKVC